jgi:hypothetical protein
MSTSTVESRFREAVRNSEATAVPMNGPGGVVFSDTPCIGTDGLGSCSVILIVSPYAAIMGHISPRPNGSNPSDPNAGDDHVRSFMDQVTHYYQQSRQSFPAGSSSWVVCAVFGGAVALPDQQRIMEKGLRDIRLPVDSSQTYLVPFTTDNPDRGSVFVDGRGDIIRVYVEDRLVRTMARSQPPLAIAGSSAATASQSYTTDVAPYTNTPSASIATTLSSAAMGQSSSSGTAATQSSYSVPTTVQPSSANTDIQGTGYWYFNTQVNKYCYYMNQQVTWSQVVPPLNQWVKQFSGWNGDTSKQYMRWNGVQAEYR